MIPCYPFQSKRFQLWLADVVRCAELHKVFCVRIQIERINKWKLKLDPIEFHSHSHSHFHSQAQFSAFLGYLHCILKICILFDVVYKIIIKEAVMWKDLTTFQQCLSSSKFTLQTLPRSRLWIQRSGFHFDFQINAEIFAFSPKINGIKFSQSDRKGKGVRDGHQIS